MTWWEDATKVLSNPGATFVFGTIFGFLGSRLTMTASERKQHSQSQYQNSVRHQQEKEKKYIDFTNAMRVYAKGSGKPTLDEFHSIATTGDLYFNELKIIASAILSGNIDKAARDRTFVPDLARALQKTIPSYYETLSQIAKQIGVEYGGAFNPSDYESIVHVVEKYASKAVIPSVADTVPRHEKRED